MESHRNHYNKRWLLANHPHYGYVTSLDTPGYTLSTAPMPKSLQRCIDLTTYQYYTTPEVITIVGPNFKLHVHEDDDTFNIDSLCIQVSGSMQIVYNWFLEVSLQIRDECVVRLHTSPPGLFIPIHYLLSHFLSRFNSPSVEYELKTLVRRYMALADPSSALELALERRPINLSQYDVPPEDEDEVPTYDDWNREELTRFFDFTYVTIQLKDHPDFEYIYNIHGEIYAHATTRLVNISRLSADSFYSTKPVDAFLETIHLPSMMHMIIDNHASAELDGVYVDIPTATRFIDTYSITRKKPLIALITKFGALS